VFEIAKVSQPTYQPIFLCPVIKVDRKTRCHFCASFTSCSWCWEAGGWSLENCHRTF